jgi:hypothetical protein
MAEQVHSNLEQQRNESQARLEAMEEEARELAESVVRAVAPPP